MLKKMNYLYQGRQKRKHKQRITFQEVSDTLETDYNPVRGDWGEELYL